MGSEMSIRDREGDDGHAFTLEFVGAGAPDESAGPHDDDAFGLGGLGRRQGKGAAHRDFGMSGIGNAGLVFRFQGALPVQSVREPRREVVCRISE